MFEERVIGNETGDGDDAPAGHCAKTRAQIGEVRNAGARQFKLRLGFQEGVAGATGQQLRLSGEKPVPAVMLLGAVGRPVLVDRPIRVAGGVRVAILDFVRGGSLHEEPHFCRDVCS